MEKEIVSHSNPKKKAGKTKNSKKINTKLKSTSKKEGKIIKNNETEKIKKESKVKKELNTNNNSKKSEKKILQYKRKKVNNNIKEKKEFQNKKDLVLPSNNKTKISKFVKTLKTNLQSITRKNNNIPKKKKEIKVKSKLKATEKLSTNNNLKQEIKKRWQYKSKKAKVQVIPMEIDTIAVNRIDVGEKKEPKMKEELIVCSNPKSRISEAIKSIKTNLQFTAIDENIKTLMITSSVPEEGKSFIAANLALAFAGSDVNVLLIDCDLRKGRQHQIFNISNASGLSNLLIDDIKIRQNYIKDTEFSKIKVIPAGVIPPNPSELLGSKKNKKLIETLKKEFDIIILDCPPVNGLADTLAMTSLADAIIVVCAQNKTKMSLLNETKKILRQLNANITGVIMNKVDIKDSDDYYRYYN